MARRTSLDDPGLSTKAFMTYNQVQKSTGPRHWRFITRLADIIGHFGSSVKGESNDKIGCASFLPTFLDGPEWKCPLLLGYI